MKKLFIALMFLVIPNVASAYWTYVTPQYHVTPYRITASIYNPYHYAIYCEGRLDGLSQSGWVANGYMATWIYPGNWGYAYVYSNNGYNPFINWGGNFYCRY